MSAPTTSTASVNSDLFSMHDCPLQIHLFGAMEVNVNGQPLKRLRTRKGMWLLAILALRADHDVDRAWLAGTLWPDSDESDSLRSLRQSLHDLRLALGSEAHRLPQDSTRSLRFQKDGAFIDALAFDRLTASGDAQSLAEAVRLHRGPLLEECAEEWCLDERRRREREYIAALEALARDAKDRREYSEAILHLRQAVTYDPFREDLQRELMQLHEAHGESAGALAIYRDLRAALWREMASAPAQETTELYRRIRESSRRTAGQASERSSTVAVRPERMYRARPPAQLTDLIGREDAVRDLKTLCARRRMVTLIGTGGIGKTRLAIRIAEEIGSEFEHGAKFVSLAALADPESIPDEIRKGLGFLQEYSRKSPIDVLIHNVESCQMLLVLDNCEHVAPACELVAASLLTACPGLHILATSRQPLGLRGEIVWRVPSLALPPPDSHMGGGLGPGDYPAIQLFVDRARASESSFELTHTTEKAVMDICRRLDGIPLAIELAAARVRTFSLREIHSRLMHGFDLLKDGNALPRHKTLSATFQWSWELLSEAERKVLRRFSVFAGGATLEAGEAICRADDLGHAEVTECIISLVDKSLIVRTAIQPGSREEPRYYLLETIRAYTKELLGDGDQAELTRRRHADYFFCWAEDIRPKLWGPDLAHWFSLLEADHDNLRLAIDWFASHGDIEKELRLCLALSRFWDTHGHLREGRERLVSAVNRITSEVPPKTEAEAHGCTAWMAGAQYDWAAAQDHYQKSLVKYREIGDAAGEAGTLNYMAYALVLEGKVVQALPLFEQSLSLSRSLSSRGGLASVLNNLGEATLRLGDLVRSRRYLDECIEVCMRVGGGSDQLRGIVSCDLSVVDLREAKSQDALTHCVDGIRLLHDCQAYVNIPAAIEQLAIIVFKFGVLESSAILFGAAENLASELSVPPSVLLELERTETKTAIQEKVGMFRYMQLLEEGSAYDVNRVVQFAIETTNPLRC